MKCHQCGYDLPETAKFCRSCGANQNQAPAVPPIEVQQPAAEVLEAQEPVAVGIKPTGAPLLAKSRVEPTPDASSMASTIAQSSQPVSSATISKTSIYAAIGVFVIIAVGGGSYYGWAQKRAADELSVQLAKQKSDEQKRKSEEEMQLRLKEAEEKGRKEAEEKAKQEAIQNAAAAQAQPQQQAAVDSLLDRATKCSVIKGCMEIMLEGVSPRKPEVIQVAATRIGEYSKPQRGDRKAARALNTRGLDEFKNNNYTTAIDLLKQAAAVDPADVEIQSNLGFVALRANRKDIAVDALTNALLIDPRRTSSWIPISELYVINSNSEGGIRALLVAYEFSANKEKSIAFFEDKSNKAERIEMQPIYKSVLDKIRSGQMN